MRNRNPLHAAVAMTATILASLALLLAVAGFARVERAADASMMDNRR